MLNLVHILSGVALILFGVRFLRKGLDRIFGPRIERVVQHLGNRPLHAAATGVSLGLAIPSSTSMAALLLEPFRTGRLRARNLFPLALGANIGMTVLVLLTSLRLDAAMPFCILLGVILFQFTHITKLRGTGQILLSLGFIFLGVTTIQMASHAISDQPDLIKLIQIAEHYPLVLTMLAACLAIGLQSSTAAILLVLGLGVDGSLSTGLALAVVIGANLGVEGTRLAISWRQTEARRMALMILAAKVLVAAIIAGLFSWIVPAMDRLPVAFELQIAIAHTGFNVVTAAAGFALISALDRMAAWLVPTPPPSVTQIFTPRYIDRGPIESPSLALGQSLREVLRAAEIVRGMLDDVWRALEKSDVELAASVSKRDDQVDILDREIKQFLTRIAGQDLDHDSALEQMRQLRFISETEVIGDIVDKNLTELILKKIRRDLKFSEEGWNDLQSLFAKVRENMVIAETAFQSRDRSLADQLLRHKEWLNNYQRHLADRHLTRLTAGQKESHETSAVHLDLLASLKRINSCVSHVAYAILLNTPAHGSRRTKQQQDDAPNTVALDMPTS